MGSQRNRLLIFMKYVSNFRHPQSLAGPALSFKRFFQGGQNPIVGQF
jgi:hypothetical protein